MPLDKPVRKINKSKPIEYRGEKYSSLSDLARFLKIGPEVLWYRIKNNLPFDTPVRKISKFKS